MLLRFLCIIQHSKRRPIITERMNKQLQTLSGELYIA